MAIFGTPTTFNTTVIGDDSLDCDVNILDNSLIVVHIGSFVPVIDDGSHMVDDLGNSYTLATTSENTLINITLTGVQNAVGSTTTYLGTFPTIPATGSSIAINGFLINVTNNGVFTVAAGSTNSTLVLNNPSGFAESTVAATAWQGTYSSMFYCLASNGSDSDADVAYIFDDIQTYATMFVWCIPVAGGTVSLGPVGHAVSASATTLTTAAISPVTATNDIMLAAASTQSNAAVVFARGKLSTHNFTLDSADFGISTFLQSGAQHIVPTATSAQAATIVMSPAADGNLTVVDFTAVALPPQTVSGNCSIPNAYITYSGGSKTGNVQADSSGNYEFTTQLGEGVSYQIWPSAPGYQFFPQSQTLVIPSNPTTGLNFTAAGILYTTVGSDNFTRANENPLSNGGTWANFTGSFLAPLQVVSDLCEATSTSAAQNGATWPASWSTSQFCQVTIPSFAATNEPEADLFLFNNGSGFNSATGFDFELLGNSNGTTSVNIENLATHKTTSVTVTVSYPATFRHEFFNGKYDAYYGSVLINSQVGVSVTANPPAIQSSVITSLNDVVFSAFLCGTANAVPPPANAPYFM